MFDSAMKTLPPSFKKDKTLTVAQRLSELNVIEDIDEMLVDGVSTGDVAKFIQLGLEELVDVKFSTLTNVLAKRRREVLDAKPEVVVNERLAAIVPTKGRKPAFLARDQYNKQSMLLDQLIEAQSVYLAQRDRLDWIIQKEQDLGFPFEMTDRTVLTVLKALETYGKIEKELFERLGSGPAHEKLSIEGYSKETSETLQKPDSRRRVVSIIERLKRVKGGAEIPELTKASGE